MMLQMCFAKEVLRARWVRTEERPKIGVRAEVLTQFGRTIESFVTTIVGTMYVFKV